MPLFLIVSEIYGRKVSKWWKIRHFFELFGPPCRNALADLDGSTVYTRMCAGLCRTYWTTFGIADKNRNGSCPMHEWDHPHVISPLFAPRGSLTPKKGEDTSRPRLRPHAKFGVNRPAGCWEIVDRTNKQTYSKTNTSPFALTSEWRVITEFLPTHLLSGYCLKSITSNGIIQLQCSVIFGLPGCV